MVESNSHKNIECEHTLFNCNRAHMWQVSPVAAPVHFLIFRKVCQIHSLVENVAGLAPDSLQGLLAVCKSDDGASTDKLL